MTMFVEKILPLHVGKIKMYEKGTFTLTSRLFCSFLSKKIRFGR